MMKRFEPEETFFTLLLDGERRPIGYEFNTPYVFIPAGTAGIWNGIMVRLASDIPVGTHKENLPIYTHEGKVILAKGFYIKDKEHIHVLTLDEQKTVIPPGHALKIEGPVLVKTLGKIRFPAALEKKNKRPVDLLSANVG